MQKSSQPALTTSQVHASPFTLLVTFGGIRLDIAEGFLYVDDGEQLVLNNKIFVVYVAESEAGYSGGTLVSKVLNNSYSLPTALLTQIQIQTPSISYDSCSYTLNAINAGDGSIITTHSSSSASVTQGVANSKVTFNFAENIAVNVATDFNMTWTCSNSDSSSSSSISGGAIAGIVVGVVAVGAIGGYLYFNSKKKNLEGDTYDPLVK